MAVEKTEDVNGAMVAKNKAVDEYYKIALQGLISGGEVSRTPKYLAEKAMQLAIFAYEQRCETLGVTYCKKW